MLKNFKRTGGMFEEFPIVKVKYEDETYTDRPICVVDEEKTFTTALAVPQQEGFPIIQELEDIKIAIKDTRIFYFDLAEGGIVKEVPEKDSKIRIRLPKDTNPNELIFVNGQILKQQKVETQEGEPKPDDKQPDKVVEIEPTKEKVVS